VTTASIAKALGGHRNGHGYLCHCGRGDRNPSLSIHDSDEGKLLVRCFAGCDARDVLAELRHHGFLDEEQRSVRRRTVSKAFSPSPPQDPEPNPIALELWRSAIQAQGTLAEKYLRNRGITIDIPPTLRFLPNFDYMPRIGFPAMVAAVQGPDRRVIACQVTLLKPDGSGKAPVSTPRKTIGALARGAVRLGTADNRLGLAEGIETALAAMQLTGVVVWACLGANRLDAVCIPSIVRYLDIFGDPDEAGRRAVTKALERYRIGRNARACFPLIGSDWNDQLARERADA